MFGLPPDNLKKFRFITYHIIDFVQSNGLRGILKQKKFQGLNPKKKIKGKEPGNDIYYRGKALLTFKAIDKPQKRPYEKLLEKPLQNLRNFLRKRINNIG